MTHLVVRDDFTLEGVQQAVLLLEPGHDAFDGGGEVLQGHGRGLASRRHQRRLVDQILELRAREPRRHRRDVVHLEPGLERQPPRPNVHAQNLLAALLIRALDGDSAVEPPRTLQRAVQHVGAVRRREANH